MTNTATLQAFINYGVENYPADKYDLILWDHGGGPRGGFGDDEHLDDSDDWFAPSTMSFEAIIEALSDNAVTNNDADGDGKSDKFDFIDFDACLMNSVELALAIADYTDYYIASAETEPGYGLYTVRVQSVTANSIQDGWTNWEIPQTTQSTTRPEEPMNSAKSS